MTDEQLTKIIEELKKTENGKEKMLDFLNRLKAGKASISEVIEHKVKNITLIESKETPDYFPGEKVELEDYLSDQEKSENVEWNFHILKIQCPNHNYNRVDE